MSTKRYYVVAYPHGLMLYEPEDEALTGDDLGKFAYLDLTGEEWREYLAAIKAFFPWQDRMSEAWHASPRAKSG